MRTSKGNTIINGSGSKLTLDYLKKILRYDPGTGEWIWLKCLARRRPVGSKAGAFSYKYMAIGINGRRYYAHRLAFFYMTGEWPSAEIDHIDKNKLNNAWNNLRAASRAQNLTNVAARSATGFKGVYWDKRRKKWKSHITHNRKTINLGRFNSPEAAHAAYMAKATELFQEFASA